MAKLVLGFIGKPLSGKGEAAEYLKMKHDASGYRFSTYLRRILDVLGIPQTRKNLQHVSLDLCRRFGYDVIAKQLIRDYAADARPLIVIDGIRLGGDVAGLRSDPDFRLVCVRADDRTRYQRSLLRGENAGEKDKTFEEFLEEELAETELLIERLGAGADFTIENSGTKEEYYAQIEAVLAAIRRP